MSIGRTGLTIQLSRYRNSTPRAVCWSEPRVRITLRPNHAGAIPRGYVMKTGIGIVVMLTLGYCGTGHAVEQEFQITPRLGFGAIKLERGSTNISVADDFE